MRKTTTFPVILTLAVVLGFFLVSAEQAEPTGPAWFSPTWQITRDGTAAPVAWKPAVNPRFAIYDPGTPEEGSDDAVLDKETGLVWERSPDTTEMDWFEATLHCYNRELSKRKGWRLPTIEELASLVDYTQPDPTLPAGHPFINVQNLNWSSTTFVGLTEGAMVVRFHDGFVFFLEKVSDRHVWCVRGGKGYDAY